MSFQLISPTSALMQQNIYSKSCSRSAAISYIYKYHLQLRTDFCSDVEQLKQVFNWVHFRQADWVYMGVMFLWQGGTLTGRTDNGYTPNSAHTVSSWAVDMYTNIHAHTAVISQDFINISSSTIKCWLVKSLKLNSAFNKICTIKC